MKKLSMILMAGLLVLGLSQCKKENTNNNNEETEGVKITLTVDDGGAKADVTPNEPYSPVTFQPDDKILVANGGLYVGYLSYQSGVFSGNITATLTDTDALHFFFVGNKVNTSNLTPGSTENITVDMSDQSGSPAVISYASLPYNGSPSVSASVKLLIKASGLVKFTTNIGTTNDVTVSKTGMYNAMNIGFGTTPSFTPAQSTTNPGAITLKRYTGDSENKTFIAVIPQQEALSGVTVTSVETRPGIVVPTVTIPAVEENTNYYDNGDDHLGVKLIIDYVFSVSNNTTVRFASGNLQYHATEQTWRFAEHQYDFAQTTNGAWNTSGWVDLFGWGTWGSGQNPLNISTDNSDYQWSSDFSGTLTNNSETGWRTLTQNEFNYLFHHRTNAKNKYAAATVCDVHGLVILPDDWTLPGNCSFTVGFANRWSTNTYDATQWTSMESAGAVFLPAAGSREQYDVGRVDYVGYLGRYWSSSTGNGDNVVETGFFDDSVYPASVGGIRRGGNSVRLVRE